MTQFFAVAVLIAALFLCGCGNAQAVGSKQDCRLGTLTIHSLVLDHDSKGYVGQAILSELYAKGARKTPGGQDLTGSIEWLPNQLFRVSLEGKTTGIAAAVEVHKNELEGLYSNPFEIAHIGEFASVASKRIAQQACACMHRNLSAP